MSISARADAILRILAEAQIIKPTLEYQRNVELAMTGLGQQWTRIIRLKPEVELRRGGWYRVTLGSGIQSNASITSEEETLLFQVVCEDTSPLLCPKYTPREAALFPEENNEAPESETKRGCQAQQQPVPWLLSVLTILCIRWRRAAPPGSS